MNGLTVWVAVFALVALGAGCSGPRTNGGGPETASASDTPSASDTTEATADSVRVEPDPAPPPQTVRLRGGVLACHDGEPPTCDIRVDEVVAYGMSTPPVAPGTRIVSVRPVVLREQSLDELSGRDDVLLMLQHAGETKQLGGEDTAAPDWALIEIRSQDG